MSSLLLPTIASASPESRELVRQGLAAVKARQFEAALEKFEAAGAADPTDAEAVFFQGLALNLLDRPAEALARLERAAAMGARHPDLAFQTGWSLLRLRRWEDAIVQLDRYERDHPGRGKTKEFLGRAYLGRGQLDRAEAALREAIRRDARLSPSAQLHLAVVAQRRGDPEAARQHLEGLLREAPEHPVGRALRDALERLARLRPPRRPERPWALALSVVGGYNSNVIALGNTIPLPEDITRKDAGFARVTVGGSYAWRPTPVDTLTAGYTFLAEVYDGLSDADVLDHFWYLDYRRLLRPDLIAGLRVSDEFTQLGEDDFRNQVAVRPAVG